MSKSEDDQDLLNAVSEAIEAVSGAGRPLDLSSATTSRAPKGLMGRSDAQLRSAFLTRLKIPGLSAEAATRSRFLSEPLPARGELLLHPDRRRSVHSSIKGPPVPIAGVRPEEASNAGGMRPAPDYPLQLASHGPPVPPISPESPPLRPQEDSTSPTNRSRRSSASSDSSRIHRPQNLSRSSADLRRRLLHRVTTPRGEHVPSITLSVLGSTSLPPGISQHTEDGGAGALTHTAEPVSESDVRKEAGGEEQSKEDGSDHAADDSSSEDEDATPDRSQKSSLRRASSPSAQQLRPATRPRRITLSSIPHGMTTAQLPEEIRFGNLVNLAITPGTPVEKGDDRWIPSSAVGRCQRCEKKFGLLVRKHHCRSCGLVVCRDW